MQIDGKREPGQPKMTWRTPTERDHREWKVNEVDPCDRGVWRFSVRSTMCAVSQLPGREPTDVDKLLHLQVNQNADDEWYFRSFNICPMT